MKISTNVVTPYLSKDDITDPIIVTMDTVTINTALRNPEVLHFADEVKPLPLNLTNKRVIVGAFGDESAAWKGQRIEIYVNPDVTNSRGEVTGGIRVRIPAAAVAGPAYRPTARNGSASKAVPAPKVTPPPTPDPQFSIREAHNIILDGFAKARTQAKLDEFAQWGTGFDFTPDQTDEQSDAYHAAKDQLAAGPASFRRPLTA